MLLLQAVIWTGLCGKEPRPPADSHGRDLGSSPPCPVEALEVCC